MSMRLCGLVVLGLLLTACGGDGDREVTVELPPTPTTPAVGVQRVFTSLPNFTDPVAMLQAPSDSNRWFVVEQAGRVLVFANQSNVSTADVFLDIRSRVGGTGEMGLLGMAFHPGFPSDRRIFLNYTNTTSGRVSRISSFNIALDGLTADPNSEQIILTINQPEDNHNGGHLAFGPDGYLYIGLGDGGGSNDQHGTIGNAQNTTTLLGKMLRINVDVTTGNFRYGIPTDNPFAANAFCGTTGNGTQSCPEIYASGLRNPWRWSFDRQNGQLWVADVGQGAMEEVNRVVLGGNYGWRCFEGTRNTGFSCGSPSNPLPPIAEYGRSLGRSITGGYVYRGTAISSLVGRYIFGDFVTGRIWNIASDASPTLTMTGGFESNLQISSFAQGQDGELYVVHYAGQLYRLTAGS